MLVSSTTAKPSSSFKSKKRRPVKAKKASVPAQALAVQRKYQMEEGLWNSIGLPERAHYSPHAARAPPSPARDRLLSKREIREIVGASFPTIWKWMQRGLFPRGRVVAGKTKWLESEVATWLNALPVRPLKGDPAKAADEAAE